MISMTSSNTKTFFRVATLCALLLVVVNSQSFDPYQLNGGLVSAVAGKNYCILAADTRMMDGGYQIHTRNLMRIFGLGMTTTMLTRGKAVLPLPELNGEIVSTIQPPLGSGRSSSSGGSTTLVAAAGCEADCNALQRRLTYQINAHIASSAEDGISNNNSFLPLATNNVAQLLSNTLYSRRNFPYYSFCVVGGLDQDGKSRVYVYDAIGSMEQVAVATAGTGRELLQPILDRLFSSSGNNKDNTVDCSSEEAITLLTQAYHAVTERDISVGDSLVLCLVSNSEDDDGSMHRKCRILRVPLKSH